MTGAQTAPHSSGVYCPDQPLAWVARPNSSLHAMAQMRARARFWLQAVRGGGSALLGIIGVISLATGVTVAAILTFVFSLSPWLIASVFLAIVLAVYADGSYRLWRVAIGESDRARKELESQPRGSGVFGNTINVGSMENVGTGIQMGSPLPTLSDSVPQKTQGGRDVRYLADLLARGQLEVCDETFRRIQFRGPGAVAFRGCKVGILVPPNITLLDWGIRKRLTGIVMFRDCEFEDCELLDIAFADDKDGLDQFRRALGTLTTPAS
jgi:hypothetical protein